MSVDEYWNGDADLVRAYRKADKLNFDRKNMEFWLQGMYIYEALCDAAPLYHDLAKKGTKAHPYSKKPYEFEKKEKKETSWVEEEKRVSEKGERFMMDFMARFNRDFVKKSADASEEVKNDGNDDYMKDAVAPARAKVLEAISQIYDMDTDSKFAKNLMQGLENVYFVEGDYAQWADEIRNKVQTAIDKSFSKDDRAALKLAKETLGLDNMDFISDDVALGIYESIRKEFGDEAANAVFKELGVNVTENIGSGMSGSSSSMSTAASTLASSATSSFEGQDWYGAGQRSAVKMANGFASVGLPSIGVSGLSTVGAGIRGIKSLSQFPMVRAFASGGYPSTGELFVAREAGAEMVGRIGRKTAVANNDQIVEGVASGVAHGQNEQNALLRQQNEYLRRIANKKFEANIVPSTALARVNRQSEQMRLRTEGG